MSTALEVGAEHRVARLVEEVRRHGFDCVVSTGLREESEMNTSGGQLARIGRYASAAVPLVP